MTMTFAGKWMYVEIIRLSEISAPPLKIKDRIFSDMWMLTYNKGWGGEE